MKLKLLPLAICSTCILITLQSFMSPRGFAAGELTPPGAPAPTMVSLGELAEQIGRIESRLDAQLPGGKVLVVSQANGAAAVWDEVSSSWNERRPGGSISPLTISNDNVLMVASNGSISVWNNTTKAWTTTSVSGSVIQAVGSNGNFFLRTTSNTVAAWNKADSQFSTMNLGATVVDQAGSEGSYLYITNTRSAAIWTPQLGAWERRSFGSDLAAFGTDSE